MKRRFIVEVTAGAGSTPEGVMKHVQEQLAHIAGPYGWKGVSTQMLPEPSPRHVEVADQYVRVDPAIHEKLDAIQADLNRNKGLNKTCEAYLVGRRAQLEDQLARLKAEAAQVNLGGSAQRLIASLENEINTINEALA